MIQINLIDATGFYVKSEIVSEESQLNQYQIKIVCPNGFYIPKWNGSKWIEGMTQKEIDAIIATNTPSYPTPDELQLQISELQEQVLILLGV